MWKIFTLKGNYKWIDELLSRVKLQCTIGMRPVDVTPAIVKRLLDTVR